MPKRKGANHDERNPKRMAMFAHDLGYLKSVFMQLGGVPRSAWDFRLRNGAPVSSYLVGGHSEYRGSILLEKALRKPELFDELWHNCGLKDVAEREVRERAHFLELLTLLVGDRIDVYQAFTSGCSSGGGNAEGTLVGVKLSDLTLSVLVDGRVEVLRPEMEANWKNALSRASLWSSVKTTVKTETRWFEVESGHSLHRLADSRHALASFLPRETAKIVCAYVYE